MRRKRRRESGKRVCRDLELGPGLARFSQRRFGNSASINKDDADDRDINTKPIIH